MQWWCNSGRWRPTQRSQRACEQWWFGRGGETCKRVPVGTCTLGRRRLEARSTENWVVCLKISCDIANPYRFTLGQWGHVLKAEEGQVTWLQWRTQLCLLWKTQCSDATWSKELSSMGCNKIPCSSKGDGTLVRMLLAAVCGHFLLVGRPSSGMNISLSMCGFFFVFSTCVCWLLLLFSYFPAKRFLTLS